jgi:hypothetical protein
MRGLDPRIHPLGKILPKEMDCRVKPGNDGEETGAATLPLIETPEDRWQRGVSS